MLTWKNLSNPIDISAKTLLCHAKDVEANAKKAFALCTSDSSPYKDFDGTFASGTNWETYIEWVRQEMFKILELDKVYEENDEDDPDEMPTVSVIEDENEEDVAVGGGCNDDEESLDEGSVDSGKIVEAILVGDEDYDVPYNWMFKGYIAFALWGYIPIPGGKKYKSLLMCALDGNDKEIEGGNRKDSRKRKIDNDSIDCLLDQRGKTKMNQTQWTTYWPNC